MTTASEIYENFSEDGRPVVTTEARKMASSIASFCERGAVYDVFVFEDGSMLIATDDGRYYVRGGV